MRFERLRGSWDESNVTILSPDIFKCGYSICQILVDSKFAGPRRTMILCLLHGDRRYVLFFFFFLSPEPVEGRVCWELFRVMSEKIQSIAVAASHSLDTKEQGRWATPFFL